MPISSCCSIEDCLYMFRVLHSVLNVGDIRLALLPLWLVLEVLVLSSESDSRSMSSISSSLSLGCSSPKLN